MIRRAVAVAVALLAFAAPAAWAAAGAPFDGRPLVASIDPGALCDRLAAYAPDPEATAPPVPGAYVSAPRAREACTDAATLSGASASDRRRWLFQLARAHYRLGEFDTAYALLERSAEAGSPGAWFVLGRLFQHGDGVRVDHTVALLHYLEAWRRGAPAGLVAAQAIYGDPDSPAYDPARHRDLPLRVRQQALTEW
ncbi:MAG: hypothetical protein AAF192_14765 [Pseudomonadota bacterium]